MSSALADDELPLITEAETRVAVATQRQLIWWRFKKHKLAVVSAFIVLAFYVLAAFADVIAYAPPFDSQAARSYIPPQGIHWFDASRHFHPQVYALKGKRDVRTFKLSYAPDPSETRNLALFAHGYPYKLFGLFPTDIHLLGVSNGQATDALFLFGTDQLGRDVFSRLVLATRTSLTIGLVGVALSLVLGVLLGGISGLYGGWVDIVVQRVIEILRSIPTIPLWMGLAAAIPMSWSPEQVYFAITVIISLIGWTELARVGTRPLPGLARGGFYHRRRTRRGLASTHHLQAHGAQLPVAHHRRDQPCAAGDDHQRNDLVVPRVGAAATGDLLGRDAAGRAESGNPRPGALAAGRGRAGDYRDSGVQFPGRRAA